MKLLRASSVTDADSLQDFAYLSAVLAVMRHQIAHIDVFNRWKVRNVVNLK